MRRVTARIGSMNGHELKMTFEDACCMVGNAEGCFS